MKAQRDLEGVSFVNGWCVYRHGKRMFVAPPPAEGQEPDLDRETNAGRITYSGTLRQVQSWLRANHVHWIDGLMVRGLKPWVDRGLKPAVDDDLDVCRGDDCTNRTDDGEGYDGYCGTCADRRDGNK